MRAPTSIAAGLLVASAPALAQYDPDAPRPSPRLRGAVVAAGGPTTNSALHHFVQLAGDAEAKIVVVDPEGALNVDWSALGAAEVTRVRNLAEAVDASAVWLELPKPLADSRAGALGTRILEKGGVVGVNETCARAAGTWRVVAGARAGHSGSEVKLEELVPGFDWFRGAFLLTGDAARERGLVEEALSARPDAVALTIPAECVLTLDERWLESHGAGTTIALMAATDERPQHFDVIGAGRTARADMLTYQRIAQQRARGPFPAAVAEAPRVEHGALMLIGGGEIPEDVLRRFVRLAGGKEARIVCIPCKYDEKAARPKSTMNLFRRLGAEEVRWIHTKDRVAADTGEEILDPLRDATGIWFGGGRQWNFVDSYQNTKAHELMEGVLARGGVIAGSSAGASIQAEYLCRGNPLGNREIMWEGYDRGLGFLRGAGVDQHFSQRGRQRDMESFVRAYPQLLGIGIDEGTALVVRGGSGEVAGAGEVWFYDHRAWDGDGDAPEPVRVGAGGRHDLAGALGK